MPIGRDTGTTELAAIVSRTLEAAGITAVLSGGAAISIYTTNRYQSSDLDFVTNEEMARLAEVLAPLGFVRGRGRHLEHPDCDLYLEFPPGPPAVGNLVITEWRRLETEHGVIQLLSPTHMVMDRLSAYFHWNDPQSLDQAVMVARDHELEWPLLEQWAESEGAKGGYETFLRRVRRG